MTIRRINQRDRRFARLAERIFDEARRAEARAVIQALDDGRPPEAGVREARWEQALRRLYAAVYSDLWEQTIRNLGGNPDDRPMDISEFERLITERARSIAEGNRRLVREQVR